MCYEGELRLPIRPLTMLFGANNAGKTAALKAIRLARQAALSGGAAFTLGGRRSGLGTFRSLRHNMQGEGGIELGVELRRTRQGVWNPVSATKATPATDLRAGEEAKPSTICLNWRLSEVADGRTVPEFDWLEVNSNGCLAAPRPDSSLYYLVDLADSIGAEASRNRWAAYPRAIDGLRFKEHSELRAQLADALSTCKTSGEQTRAVFGLALTNRTRDLKLRPRSSLVTQLAHLLAPHAPELQAMCRLELVQRVLRDILDAASSNWLLVESSFYSLHTFFGEPTKLTPEQARVGGRIHRFLAEARSKLEDALSFQSFIEQGKLRSADDFVLACAHAMDGLKSVLRDLAVPDAILAQTAPLGYAAFADLSSAISASVFGSVDWPEGAEPVQLAPAYDAVRELDLYIHGFAKDLRLLAAIPRDDPDRMALWLECYLWTYPRPTCSEAVLSGRLDIWDYDQSPPGSPASGDWLEDGACHPLIGPREGNILGKHFRKIVERDGLGPAELLQPRALVHDAWNLSASLFSKASFLSPTREAGAFFYEEGSNAGAGNIAEQEPTALNLHAYEADVNKMLNALAPGLEIRGRLAQDMPSEAWVLETRSGGGPWVSIAHSGSGISQVVPVLLSLADRSTALRCVQQPELHLHPRMQAALMEEIYRQCAELAAEPGLGILRAIRRQLAGERAMSCTLVETHSELMVLRLKRLMRRDYARDPAAAERAHGRVALLYVEREGDHSTLSEIRIGPDGAFLESWPGGFFSERLEELLE